MRNCEAPVQVKPGRPRSSATDEAILGAALKLFIERGIHGVGIEQIAKYAGVARTTVYRRWSSKEALISAAIAEYRGAADESALKRWASPSDMLDEVIDALVDTLAAPDYQKIVARLVGSTPDYPELMSAYWENYLVPRRNAAGEVLDWARAEGLLPSETDPEILLDLIAGGVMHHILVRQADRSKGKLREYIIKIFRTLGLLSAKDRCTERDGGTKRGRP